MEVYTKCVVSEDQCHVPYFRMTTPAGALLFNIKTGKVDNFERNLKDVKNLLLKDCEALTLYAVQNNQEMILVPLFKRIGQEGVEEMHFDLPKAKLLQNGAEHDNLEASTNNNLLHLSAFKQSPEIEAALRMAGVSMTRMESQENSLNMKPQELDYKVGKYQIEPQRKKDLTHEMPKIPLVKIVGGKKGPKNY